jgi:glycosyltransferase involved in cell wall biosynthesis
VSRGNMAIVFNGRFRSSRVTGVQRYANEVVRQLAEKIRALAPRVPLNAISGQLWEQFLLPVRVGSRLLWSPANTGPLSVTHQVVSILDTSSLDHPEWFSRRFAAWYGWLLPRLAQRVRRVITISEFSRRRIVEHAGIDLARVVVTHCGVERRFFEGGKGQDVFSHLEIPPTNYILSVGSSEPRKNLRRLMAAWELVYKDLPADVWLLLAGGQGDPAIFADSSLGSLPPRVRQLGYVPDDSLPGLYSNALAFVYPSLYEGFGLPPLEAMAGGTAVVAGDRGALPEVVGDAGILIDPLDPSTIAAALLLVIEDDQLRARLETEGRARAARFTWERTATRTWEVLQEAIEEAS